MMLFSNFIHQFLNIGIDNNMPNNEKRATVMVNRVAVLICFTSILYTITNYFIAPELFAYSIIGLPIFFISILLNYNKLHYFAKAYTMIALVFFSNFFEILLGEKSGVWIYNFVTGTLALFIFTRNKDITWGLILTIIGTILVTIYEYYHPPKLLFSELSYEIFRNLNVFSTFIVLYLLIKSFRNLNAKFETELLERNYEITQAHEELSTTLELINEQKQEIEEKNADITASINYAKRIQMAMLPEKSEIVKFLPNFFIFYKPRDIVSGDFYWIHQIENSNKSNSNNIERQITIIAVADCTGHGVPGAFMSMIGNELLNDIVISRTIISPELILQNLHIGIRHALQQQKSENQDGMDISVVTLHKNSQNPQKTHKIDYAGAMNPFYMVSNEILEKENELEVGKTVALIIEKQQNSYFYEVKADKKPVGGKQIEEERIFTKHSFLCKSNTKITIYLFSDGYQDQFGGQDGKKFMVKKFKELLQTISSETIKKQELILAETFEKWKINTKQVDDVLVLGIEI